MTKGQVSVGGGPKSGLGVPENKNLKPTPGIELRLLGHPASRPVEYANTAVHKSDFFENWAPSKQLITKLWRLLSTTISRRTHQLQPFSPFYLYRKTDLRFRNAVLQKKWDRQCTYYVTLQRVRVTTVVVDKPQCILCVCVCCSATRHIQLHQNIESCTTMLWWQIYFAGNNKTHVGLRVKCNGVALKQKNVPWRTNFFRRTIRPNIVKTGKALTGAAVFVNVAVKLWINLPT